MGLYGGLKFRLSIEESGIWCGVIGASDDPEPEMSDALSPRRQVDLLRFLDRLQRTGDRQVIMATHLPLLMALRCAAALAGNAATALPTWTCTRHRISGCIPTSPPTRRVSGRGAGSGRRSGLIRAPLEPLPPILYRPYIQAESPMP